MGHPRFKGSLLISIVKPFKDHTNRTRLHCGTRRSPHDRLLVETEGSLKFPVGGEKLSQNISRSVNTVRDAWAPVLNDWDNSTLCQTNATVRTVQHEIVLRHNLGRTWCKQMRPWTRNKLNNYPAWLPNVQRQSGTPRRRS